MTERGVMFQVWFKMSIYRSIYHRAFDLSQGKLEIAVDLSQGKLPRGKLPMILPPLPPPNGPNPPPPCQPLLKPPEYQQP